MLREEMKAPAGGIVARIAAIAGRMMVLCFTALVAWWPLTMVAALFMFDAPTAGGLPV